LKRNHISRIEIAQEKVRSITGEGLDTKDTYKLAKTILSQSTLLPITTVVQPIIWGFGDCLNLLPHPDFLILADDCEDYYH
jgi:hypothetical protein